MNEATITRKYFTKTDFDCDLNDAENNIKLIPGCWSLKFGGLGESNLKNKT